MAATHTAGRYAPPPLSVVLVEPRIPQNTGNIARLCACAGVPLHLLGELGFELGDKQVARAGMDYLDRVEPEHHTDVAGFFVEHAGRVPYFFSTKATKTLWEVDFQFPAMLVFGREDKGLPESILAKAPQQCVSIPMVAGPRSLNLSTSVSAVLYEVWRQHAAADLEQGPLH